MDPQIRQRPAEVAPVLLERVHELELKDRTIQALFGLGLKLEYCIALIDEAPEQAKLGVDSSITTLSELIGEIRLRLEDDARRGC
jgi:hypothetical protein